MSFFRKIQEKIIPVSISETPIYVPKQPIDVKHEFANFSSSYRIGILGFYTDNVGQEIINNYKKLIEKNGFECEVLLFVDKKEKDNHVFLQSYNWEDLDKRTFLPYSPRTDRFIMKRFDLLLNLYFQPISSLIYISKMSRAKCRVGPFMETFKESIDLLIPFEENETLETFINKINEILILKPYERKII